VLVHAIGAEYLELDGQIAEVQPAGELGGELAVGQQLGLDLPQLLNCLDELAGGDQRLRRHDLDLQKLSSRSILALELVA